VENLLEDAVLGQIVDVVPSIVETGSQADCGDFAITCNDSGKSVVGARCWFTL